MLVRNTGNEKRSMKYVFEFFLKYCYKLFYNNVDFITFSFDIKFSSRPFVITFILSVTFTVKLKLFFSFFALPHYHFQHLNCQENKRRWGRNWYVSERRKPCSSTDIFFFLTDICFKLNF